MIFSLLMRVQRQLSENVFIDERRPVLLCDGKLCLRALQDLFNLTIVEMMYGKWKVRNSHTNLEKKFSLSVKCSSYLSGASSKLHCM